MKKFNYLYPRNNIFYLCYTDEAGENRRISTGQKNKIDAEKFAAAFLGTGPDQVAKGPEKLLSAFRDEYIQFASLSSSKSYIENGIKISFKQLIGYSGDLNLDQLDRRLLETFLRDKFSKSKYSAYLYHRVLRAAFNVAVRWNYMEVNPLPEIKLPKIPKPFPLFISIKELNSILRNVKDLLLKRFYIFAFHTGLRLSEQINLKWNAVNIRKGKITVKIDIGFIPKGKKERIVPINKATAGILKSMLPKVISLDNNEYVFKDRYGKQLKQDFVSKNFKRAVRNTAGIDNKIHYHSLRHSFASNLVQAGVSLVVIKELLGHEDLQTTYIYSHLQFTNLIDAVKVLDKRRSGDLKRKKKSEKNLKTKLKLL